MTVVVVRYSPTRVFMDGYPLAAGLSILVPGVSPTAGSPGKDC
ncbi:hypothetical protein [Candidatus Spongiisocius sp.]